MAAPPDPDKRWYVYMVRASDYSLYTGSTSNPQKRFQEHVSQGKRTAKYLRGKIPLKLVYCEELSSKSDALKREHDIKRMKKVQKEALITQQPQN